MAVKTLVDTDSVQVLYNKNLRDPSNLLPFPFTTYISTPYDYGAVGDGVTDDAVALNAWLNTTPAGYGLYLPPATFACSGLLLSTSNRFIFGLSPLVSKLKLLDASDVDLFAVGSAVGGLTMRSIGLDGNKAGQGVETTPLAWVFGGAGASYCRLADLIIEDAGESGILIRITDDVVIEGCRVLRTGATADPIPLNAAIYIDRCTNYVIRGNLVDDCTGLGIRLGNGSTHDGVISGNRVSNCYYIGIACASLNERVTVSGNVVKDVTGNGIDTGSCLALTCTGNSVTDCEAGIIFDSADGQTIVGNAVKNMVVSGGAYVVGGLGIGGVLSSNIIIADNIVDTTWGAGIGLRGVAHGTVTGNLVKNTSQDGNGAGGVGGIDVLGFTGANNENIVVADNRCYDDQAPTTQKFGIVVRQLTAGTNTRIDVHDNDVVGNGTQGTLVAGSGNTNIRFNRNMGVPSSGTITVADAATTGAASFSVLELDPDYRLTVIPVTITGGASAGSSRVRSIAKTTSGFTITVEAAPGAGTSVAFDWTVTRENA